MVWFILWIALSIVAGVVANNKGRSGAGFFFLALLLSPIVGLIAALVATPDTKIIEAEKIISGQSRKCPYCAELIKREATVCRFCGRGLPEILSQSSAPHPPDISPERQKRDKRLAVWIIALAAAAVVGLFFLQLLGDPK